MDSLLKRLIDNLKLAISNPWLRWSATLVVVFFLFKWDALKLEILSNKITEPGGLLLFGKAGLCYLLDQVIQIVRLYFLLKLTGLKGQFWEIAKIVWIGAFFNQWLPGGSGGDIIRIVYLVKLYREHKIKAIAVSIVDLYMTLFTLSLMPSLYRLGIDTLGIGAKEQSLLNAMYWPTLGFSFLLLSFALIFVYSNGQQWIQKVSEKALQPLISTLQSKSSHWGMQFNHGNPVLALFVEIKGLFKGSKPYLRVTALLMILILCFLANFSTLFGISFFLSQPSNILPNLYLGSIGFFLNMVPLTPGGIGLGEGIFEFIFKFIGDKNGAEALLAWRIISGLLSFPAVLLFFAPKNQ